MCCALGLLSSLALAMSSCAVSAQAEQYELDEIYLLNYGAPPDCDCLLRINGEPVYHVRGEVSGMLDVTCFVVNGKNTLAIRAEWQAGREMTGFFALFRAQRGALNAPAEIARFDLETKDTGVLERTVEFTAKIPFRWAWQAADAIDEVTIADKNAMLSVLEKLNARVIAHDPNAITAIRHSWLPEGRISLPDGTQPEPTGAALEAEKKRVRAVRSARVLPMDDWRIVVGRRLVRVESRHARWIVHEGPAAYLLWATQSTGVDPNASDDRMVLGEKHVYFSRVAGEWHLYTPNWAARPKRGRIPEPPVSGTLPASKPASDQP